MNIKDYIITSSHFYENAVRGLENWIIGPDCIFKTKKQLEEYSDNCYQEELKEWKNAFFQYCLENSIGANVEIFEQFLDFDFSPYLNVLPPYNPDQHCSSWEKFFEKFFEVCHPDMLEPVDLDSNL